MSKGLRDALLEKLKSSDLKIEDRKVGKIAEEIEIAMFGNFQNMLSSLFILDLSRDVRRGRTEIQEQIQELNLQHQGPQERRPLPEDLTERSSTS